MNNNKMKLNIAPIELGIAVVYLISKMIIGVMSTRRQKMKGENYFLLARGVV